MSYKLRYSAETGLTEMGKDINSIRNRSQVSSVYATLFYSTACFIHDKKSTKLKRRHSNARFI